MKIITRPLQSSAGRWLGLALLSMSVLAVSACHDRNPTVQQPFGPTESSTSPTSTTPRQPASNKSVLSPAKPATTAQPSPPHS